MLIALLAAAVAAEPPSLESPVATGARARKDAALIVGNQDYATLADAPGAAADAEAFTGFVVATRGVAAERVLTLVNADANQIRAGVQAAAKHVKKGGTLWIYWSGHGALDGNGQRTLLGVDVAGPTEGVPLAEVLRVAEGSRAGRVIAVVDAGFGGLGRDGEPLWTAPADAPEAPKTLPPPAVTGRTTAWLGTTGLEPAYAYPAAKRGLFSYFALGALRGWADGSMGTAADGTVTVQEAQGWVAKVVRSVGGGEQKPGKETRADVVAWPLAAGALEAPPSKEDLAALALAEKTRRVKKAEAVVLAEATAAWKALAPSTEKSSPAAKEALAAYIAKYDAATVTVDGTQIAVAVPEVAEARGRLDTFARSERKGKRKRGKKVRPPPPPAPLVPTAPCLDLVKLEPAAITGTLTPELTTCIEARLAAEKAQTTRDKLSRLLLVDADARGDAAAWQKLAERHLEEVDRSDPDLCFKYALTLSRGAIEDAESVLRWTDYALENKHVWEGPTYMSRVYNLLRLRAETATRLWHDAEDEFLLDRSDENADLAEKLRGRAKDSSREWLDYARSSGQSVDRPLVLCQSASGSESFCAAG